MRKRTKATSIDIAHRAGVSQATVSRVLSGSPLVNAETRRRVEAVARELNYKVDRHASSLRTQRSATLALLPLAAALLAPPARIETVTIAATLLGLCVSGALAARAGGAAIARGAMRVVFWGALAMAAASLIGRLFHVSL